MNANITFLRPAKLGYVYAEAVEVFNHHRIPFVEVKITDGQGELIAVFTSSGYRKESDLSLIHILQSRLFSVSHVPR